MVARAAKLIGDEWKISLFFVVIILVLGSLSIYALQGTIFRIFILFFGLCVYNAYFFYLGKALKGEETPSPYKFILFGKDKARYDFFVLLAFFSAILLILYGPFVLFQALLMNKLDSLKISMNISLKIFFKIEMTIWPLKILYDMAILIGLIVYKISLYSAVSSLTYQRHQVLEAFKNGIRGIWRFKGLLAVFAIFEITVSTLLAMTQGAIQNGVALISYVIPAVIMLLMSCSYSLAASPMPEEGVPADAIQPIPSKGIE